MRDYRRIMARWMANATSYVKGQGRGRPAALMHSPSREVVPRLEWRPHGAYDYCMLLREVGWCMGGLMETTPGRGHASTSLKLPGAKVGGVPHGRRRALGLERGASA